MIRADAPSFLRSVLHMADTNPDLYIVQEWPPADLPPMFGSLKHSWPGWAISTESMIVQIYRAGDVWTVAVKDDEGISFVTDDDRAVYEWFQSMPVNAEHWPKARA